MPDFDHLAAIRGPKLADLSVHVDDILAITLAAADEYQVGQLTLSAYDFVPYALVGMSAAMRTPAAGNRATTLVKLPLADDTGGRSDAAQREVALYGPGDVLGVDRGQIVRRHPAPGSTRAEETFHAHIEFDRPELPWAFSAATPAERMPAWLGLVVLARDEIEWEPAQTGLQPVISVSATHLPPLGEAWAWAHAQAPGGGSSLSARLSTAYAPVNVSRLLAARILTQNTDYVACLVPTIDAGRRAGLGMAPGTLAPAWAPQDGTVRLPVYDSWAFRTAPDGDFARLARRLEPAPAPWQVGRRTLDASRPGAPLDDLAADEPGRRQTIRCALFSPASPPPGEPTDGATWSSARIAALREAVEAPGRLEGRAATPPGQLPDLPLLGPRLYAKGQRGRATIPPGDWFADVNLTPAHRVVAGLGTRVVATDQESLMQAAWAQVGAIDKANRELELAELARNLAASLHARVSRLEPGRLLQLTRPLAPRTKLDGDALTLDGRTVRSATPAAALGGAFRRAVRATGPLASRLDGEQRAALARLVADASGTRDFTRPYANPDGIGGLSPVALESLDAAAVARVVDAPPDQALARVRAASALLHDAGTLATAISTPATWGAPDTGFRPGVAATERLVERIRTRIPDDVRTDPVRSRALGGLAAGLAVSGVETTTALHGPALAMFEVVATTGAEVAATTAVPRAMGIEGAVARPAAARMLRSAAADVRVTDAAPLSARASGAVLGSINRAQRVPVAQVERLTERQRLDRLRTPQGTQLAMWAERAARVTTLDVRARVAALVEGPGALALAPTPARPLLGVGPGDLLTRLHPDRTVIAGIASRLDLAGIDFAVVADAMIRPIMAAPRFDRPMYEALDAYDRDWLVPGLGLLDEPEMVTLLSANDAFVEAFLVGLSDELGRELLWRGYPTDTRGTYFRRFWDPARDELLSDIHRFTRTSLGSHVGFGPTARSGRAVVVIRGEVVRRHPDLTVTALRQQGEQDGLPLLPEAPTGPPDAARALFHAMLPPDILLAGLDVTVDELRRPGWWIVVGEHPQAARFRRREVDVAGDAVRFAAPGDAASGADVAADRLEHPTRVAFEAATFLPVP